MTFSPVLVLALGSVGGRVVGGDRLRALLRQEEGGEDEDDDDEDEDPGSSALGALLRHELSLPHRAPDDQRTALEWIEDNRVWLVPYISAIFVVLVVLGSVLFAPRPLPPEGYIVLSAFWVFAVGRGKRQYRRLRRRKRELRRVARVLRIPEHQLADEFAEFKLRKLRLPVGRNDDDA